MLAGHRFTNAYRVTDRVSQYLLREVQYRPDRPRTVPEVFFRTIMFKLFNRIATWETLEGTLGPLTWEETGPARLRDALDAMRAGGLTLYSAAYVMPPTGLEATKHAGHVALVARMMEERVPERAAQLPSLDAVYRLLLSFPGLGPFLAFQLASDLNYSSVLDHDEAAFVVAGPGARDGLSKCFADWREHSPEALIAWTAARQDEEFARRDLAFARPGGRPLQLIDCQNLFCEISKYARLTHPDIPGIAGRTRVKQRFASEARPALPPMRLPAKWNRLSAAEGLVEVALW